MSFGVDMILTEFKTVITELRHAGPRERPNQTQTKTETGRARRMDGNIHRRLPMTAGGYILRMQQGSEDADADADGTTTKMKWTENTSEMTVRRRRRPGRYRRLPTRTAASSDNSLQ